jgi:hypothetical protein
VKEKAELPGPYRILALPPPALPLVPMISARPERFQFESIE